MQVFPFLRCYLYRYLCKIWRHRRVQDMFMYENTCFFFPTLVTAAVNINYQSTVVWTAPFYSHILKVITFVLNPTEFWKVSYSCTRTTYSSDGDQMLLLIGNRWAKRRNRWWGSLPPHLSRLTNRTAPQRGNGTEFSNEWVNFLIKQLTCCSVNWSGVRDVRCE